MNTTPTTSAGRGAAGPVSACASARIHGAGEAVDQRDAIQQQAGGQRAEHEVLQPGFGRAQIVAGEGARARRAPATAARARDTASSGWRRCHHHHADGREQHQHRELEPADPLAARCSRAPASIASAGAGQDQQLHEGRERIDRRTARDSRRRAARTAPARGQQQAPSAEHGAERSCCRACAARRRSGSPCAQQASTISGRASGPVHRRRPPPSCMRDAAPPRAARPSRCTLASKNCVKLRRVDAHPQRQHDQRREHRHLARRQIEDRRRSSRVSSPKMTRRYRYSM